MQGKARFYFLPLLSVLLTLALIIFSKEGYSAALNGLKLFLDIVFPSLLPFFVLSEIILGLGVVHFMGVLLEPLMRPLFNVPGSGAFVFSMGIAAGYPMDAVITGKFRRNRMCTRIEGERLLAFTNTADPLFIFGAVAVGMFNDPGLGYPLAAAHYLAAIAVGLVFRFYGRYDPERLEYRVAAAPGVTILKKAFQELYRAQVEDGRPLGKLVGDAVTDAVRNLLMIGGFIMFFSVLSQILQVAGAGTYLGLPVAYLLKGLGMRETLVPAVISGLMEIDIGTMQASQALAPLVQQLAIVSAIIGWSGLSVHGQVAAVLSGTDISMRPYALARLLHAVLAAVFTILILPSHGHTFLGAELAPVMALPRSSVVPYWPQSLVIRSLQLKVTLIMLSLVLLASLFRVKARPR